MALTLPAATLAEAQSNADILRKHRLLGTRAIDCSQPPSASNSYLVYRVERDGAIKSDFIGANGQLISSTFVLAVEEVGPDRLRITETSANNPADQVIVTMQIGERGTRTLTSVLGDGRKLIDDGRIVATNTETVWLSICGR